MSFKDNEAAIQDSQDEAVVPVSTGVAMEVDPKGVAVIKPAGRADLVGAVVMDLVGTTDTELVEKADMDGAKGADSALCGVVAEVDIKNVLIRLPRPSFLIFLSCLSVISEIYTDMNVNEVFQNF